MDIPAKDNYPPPTRNAELGSAVFGLTPQWPAKKCRTEGGKVLV